LAAQRRGRTRLARETQDDISVLRIPPKKLDRDELSQAEVRRLNHNPHAAGAEHALHAVLAAQDCARLRRMRRHWSLLDTTVPGGSWTLGRPRVRPCSWATRE